LSILPDPQRDTAAEIGEREQRALARSLLGIQWLLALIVVLYLLLAEPQAFGTPAALLLLALYLGCLGVLALGMRRQWWAPRWRLALELVSMLAFITALLALTGLERGLANLYFLPVVASGLALGRTSLLVTVVLVTTAYLGISLSAAGGVLTGGLLAEALLQLTPLWLVAILTGLLLAHIHEARSRIHALSDHDELTGLLNATAFNQLLQREQASAARYQRRYTVLMVAIQGHAGIVESLGQNAGIQALRLVGDALRRVVRTSDALARLNDDQFAVFLAETPRGVAETVAQRIRNVVFATTLRLGSEMRRVQVSVGVACFPEDGAGEALAAAAQKAMRQDGQLRTSPPGRLVVRKR